MPDPGSVACSIPGIVQLCDLGGPAKSAVTSAGNNVLDGAAKWLANGFGKAVELLNTFWVHVPTPELNASSGAVGALRTDLAWVTGAVAVAGILIGAAKMMLSRSSKPAATLALGLGRLMFASFVLLPAVVLLTSFGDDFATWVIGQSTGGQFGTSMAGVAAGLAAIDPALLLVVAGVGIASSLIQLVLMLLRTAVLVLLAGVIPTLAAGSTTEGGEHAYRKALHWLIAFTLYKPLAALVYAGAFLAVGKGDSVMEAMAGFTLMILAIVALPALLKLVHPAADAVTGMTDGAMQRHAVTASTATGAAKGAVGAKTVLGGAAGAVGGAAAAGGQWAVRSVAQKSSTPTGSTK